MQKDKEMDMFSFSKVIARCLKNYIDNGTSASDKICSECGAEDSLVYQEGCVTCKSCGSGKCG
jgi:ribonucleoside-diphosphate reductase alpha chain